MLTKKKELINHMNARIYVDLYAKQKRKIRFIQVSIQKKLAEDIKNNGSTKA